MNKILSIGERAKPKRLPPPPKILTLKEEKEHWKFLVKCMQEAGIEFDPLDQMLMVLYCQHAAKVQKFAHVDETSTTRYGVVQSPEHKVWLASSKELLMISRKLGLSPKDRAGIDTNKKPKFTVAQRKRG